MHVHVHVHDHVAVAVHAHDRVVNTIVLDALIDPSSTCAYADQDLGARET